MSAIGAARRDLIRLWVIFARQRRLRFTSGVGGVVEINFQKTDIRAGISEAGGILTVADALSEGEALAISGH